MTLDSALSGLLDGRLSRTESDAIVRAALAHARGYLRWLVWQRQYSLHPLGMSIDDLAADAVAELLSEIDGERMTRLRTALADVLATNDGDVPVAGAFKAVVLRTVRLNLARVFMEMHPVRARLLRSLRRYVTSSSRFVRIDGVAGYWYAFAEGDAQLRQPAAPPDLLRSLLAAPRVQVQPAAEVLEALLIALGAFPSLRQAVSEDDVLDLTLQLLQTDQLAALPQESSNEEPALDGTVLEEEAVAALASLRDWVEHAYVRREKLDTEEAEAMMEAAARYIRDLARGEERSHFHYLRELLPGLRHDDYRRRYRNTYEYILRTVFTTAASRLQWTGDGREHPAPSRQETTS